MLQGPKPKERPGTKYAALKKLVEAGEDNRGKAFNRLTEMLKSSGASADIRVDIVKRAAVDSWSVSLDGKRGSVSNRLARHPDVHVIVAEQSWQEIAEGARSPIDAFLQGDLRIRGDLELAARLFRRVAARGSTDIFGTEA